MDENKSRDIFYGVIAIATLIVALIGATLAYFSISASSNEGAVNAKAAVVSIEYKDGQKVIAQANELIPASLQVVQSVYEANITNLDTQEASDEEEARTNVCVDSNDREVCSIYRFSVKSDISRSITATLKSENNEFAFLAYAVRDVSSGTWLSLDNGGNQSIAITKCGTEDEDPSKNCYNVSGQTKDYTSIAKNSIFGLDASNKFVEKTVGPTEQIYDVVLFIQENNEDQNEDQGKSFQGTISVDVNDNNETISGYYNG